MEKEVKILVEEYYIPGIIIAIFISIVIFIIGFVINYCMINTEVPLFLSIMSYIILSGIVLLDMYILDNSFKKEKTIKKVKVISNE